LFFSRPDGLKIGGDEYFRVKVRKARVFSYALDLLFYPFCPYGNMQVMRDGMIAQSGKYDELIEAGSDFASFVAAHDSSMELMEQSQPVEKTEHSLRSTSIGKGEKAVVAPDIEAGTSKIIQEEERESGQVSWRVYELYMTEAWGWWGVVGMIGLALVWQGFLESM
jgi:hypothetical protein